MSTKKNTKKKSVKVSKKKKDEEEKEVKIEVPKKRHIKPAQYSICKVGMEVYETDEENFEPYVSSFNQAEGVSVKSKDTGESEESTGSEQDVESDSGEEEENVGYELHKGEIIGTHYVNAIKSMSYETDYKEMTSAGTVKLDTVDLEKFYKGVRLQLLSEWEKSLTSLKWEDLQQGVLGFITEQTFSDNNVEIKVSGITKLLEEKGKFDFKQMKRSEILRELILIAGLKPFINVEGLDDDVTSFSNLSSDNKEGSSSSLAGGQGAEIDSLVKQWVGSETNDLEKAKKVHYGLRDYGIRYRKYYNTEYKTPENCLKHARDPGINCGDCAILTTACMLSAGLNAYIVLRCDSEHFFTVIEIGGTKYHSDLTWSEGNLSQREWNSVWEENTCGSKYNDGKSIA